MLIFLFKNNSIDILVWHTHKKKLVWYSKKWKENGVIFCNKLPPLFHSFEEKKMEDTLNIVGAWNNMVDIFMD